MTVTIKGYVVVIDKTSLPLIKEGGWCPSKQKNGRVYFQRNRSGKREFLHRVIAGVSCGDTDHRNGDTLDLRKKNLRPASRSQNMMNRGRQKNNKSGYKGVSWAPWTNRWRAQISFGGIFYHIGYFTDPKKAAKAYAAEAKTIAGLFSKADA
jgi:hypothetical protein